MAAFEKERCPYCGDTNCEADWTDVGVGHVQSGPYHCYACGSTEIGGYDETTASADEQRLGWYAPNSDSLPNTISTINGEYLDSETALTMYRQGVVGQVPFKLQVGPAQFARMMGFRPAAPAYAPVAELDL